MLWAFFHTLQSYICLWNLPWAKNGSKDRSAREWKVENMRMFDLIEIYEIYCFLWWLKHMGSLIKFKGTKSRSRNLKSVKPDTNLPTWILNKHLVKIPSKISQWVSRFSKEDRKETDSLDGQLYLMYYEHPLIWKAISGPD